MDSVQLTQWAVGILVGVGAAAFWRIMGSISAANKRIDELKDTMNDRINRIRDEFVRTDQLDVHLKPIKEALERLYKQIDRHFGAGKSD